MHDVSRGEVEDVKVAVPLPQSPPPIDDHASIPDHPLTKHWLATKSLADCT